MTRVNAAMRAVTPWICLAIAATVAIGCKGDDAPPATPQIPVPGVPAPGPTMPGTPAATAPSMNPALMRITDHVPLATGMTVEFLDRQFYHAGSRNRFIRDARNLDATPRRFSGTDFRIGLILSARNDTDFLLDTPRVLSDVTIHGANGEVRCRTEVNRYGYPIVGVLSANVDPRTAWGDESRSFNESPWRPGETIRVVVGLECGTMHLEDIDIQGMSGPVRLAARAIFVRSEDPCPLPNQHVCANDVVGTSASLDLPTRAIVLQQVQLPTGQSGYSAGDLFIRSEGGRILHENLGTYLASAFTATGSDLPAQATFGREAVDEWTMLITGATIRPWSEVPGTPKGQRIVTVTADVAVDANAVLTRLTAASDPETAAGDVEGERGRLSGLLACDAVELVTQTRRVRSTNGRDVKALCSTLETEGVAHLSWTFAVDRYDLPLGIAYTIDRVPHASFFANQTLTHFDAH